MKDDKEIKVLGLNIQIGGKEIKLSKDEAKKLKEALDDIFGKEIVKEHIHHHDWYTYPRYWYTSEPQKIEPYTVYGSSSGSFCSLALNGNENEGHISLNIS